MEKEEYIEQFNQLINASECFLTQVTNNPKFLKAYAKCAKSVVRAFEAEGFNRDEAILLCARALTQLVKSS